MEKRLPRGAGILLPISSLPSPYGIGTLGDAAFSFVDFLKKGGQRYWQVLPVGPTGYGNSPYQSFSSFAGNPYFIDLDRLRDEALLTARELRPLMQPFTDQVDYSALFPARIELLGQAWKRFRANETPAFAAFCSRHADWLEDYALFMALKEHFGWQEWLLWDEDIRLREPQALRRFEKLLADRIGFWKFCQYQFFRQWIALRQYANQSGISLIGDLPIYAALDSADVWANRRLFQLDEEGRPTAVAGVPPDAFSATGQRWGNPLYDWTCMEQDGFSWWRHRAVASAGLYDVIRIDHFIGISRYYAIPADSDTAAKGEWREGPGKKLTDAIGRAAPGAHILAEDLGVLHPSVRSLLRETGYPGMRVLLFGFDGQPQNEHLPHNFQSQNLVVYGGTHDNDTILGFCRKADPETLSFMMRYLRVRSPLHIPNAMLYTAYASIADVAIFQMQDLLILDNSARMNTPATVGGNWSWRLRPQDITDRLAGQLRELTVLYNR